MGILSNVTVQPDVSLNLGALAREMVMGIRPQAKVLEMFNITEAQFKEIMVLPFYKRVHEALTIEWESATSTNKRLAVQAGAALEEILPRVVARCANANEALPAVLTGVQTLAKLAGAGEDKTAQNQGEKFRIVINLGADKIEFNETKKMVEVIETPLLADQMDDKIKPNEI
jgi:hypothetical protein